jgi:addiction module RelE/StbE family toxin
VRDLVWTHAARTDLLAIVTYIADDNPAAAQALKDEIETKVSRLPDNPRLYRAGRVTGTREMVVRRTYVVVYAHDETAVTILRVLHTAQQWP